MKLHHSHDDIVLGKNLITFLWDNHYDESLTMDAFAKNCLKIVGWHWCSCRKNKDIQLQGKQIIFAIFGIKTNY